MLLLFKRTKAYNSILNKIYRARELGHFIAFFMQSANKIYHFWSWEYQYIATSAGRSEVHIATLPINVNNDDDTCITRHVWEASYDVYSHTKYEQVLLNVISSQRSSQLVLTALSRIKRIFFLATFKTWLSLTYSDSDCTLGIQGAIVPLTSKMIRVIVLNVIIKKWPIDHLRSLKELKMAYLQNALPNHCSDIKTRCTIAGILQYIVGSNGIMLSLTILLLCFFFSSNIGNHLRW